MGLYTLPVAQSPKGDADLRTTLPDGTVVITPSSIALVTPFILQEKGDWFEAEIAFVRKALAPGETAFDVGANYGLYTLALAKAVGPEGRVLAFEPAQETLEYLQATMAANGFNHVQLTKAAVGGEVGECKFGIGDFSEMNLVIGEGEVPAEVHQIDVVPMTTLDAIQATGEWPQVDFVKLDAEGQEPAILAGGGTFFEQQSPLVMIELMHGHEVHLELLEPFLNWGYETYRYRPGIGILTREQPPYSSLSFELNGFLCKPDRAKTLEARGLLTMTPNEDCARPQSTWRTHLPGLPFAQEFLSGWDRQTGRDMRPSVRKHLAAIDAYLASLNPTFSAADRYSHLMNARDIMRELLGVDGNEARLSTLCRIEAAFGERAPTCSAIEALGQRLQAVQDPVLTEPFLPPTDEFDHIAPTGSRHGWIAAAVLTAYEKHRGISARYDIEGSIQFAQQVEQMGYQPESLRRIKDVCSRFLNLKPG